MEDIIKTLESLTKKLMLNQKERIALDELIDRKVQVELKKAKLNCNHCSFKEWYVEDGNNM